MGLITGISIWNSLMGLLHGITSWDYFMGYHGINSWDESMGQINGINMRLLWDYYGNIDIESPCTWISKDILVIDIYIYVYIYI